MTSVTREIVTEAMTEITKIEGIGMQPKYLALDVFALSLIFSEEERFKSVMKSVVKAIKLVRDDPKVGEKLDRELKDYISYHFNSPYPKYPEEEDMRMVYEDKKRKKVDRDLEILAFGHRYNPDNFYKRINNRT